jgi:DNA-directed RNA polymerase specialized sigma24 family protein
MKLTYRQIAMRTGRTEDAVRNHVFKCLQKARLVLERRYAGYGEGRRLRGGA